MYANPGYSQTFRIQSLFSLYTYIRQQCKQRVNHNWIDTSVPTLRISAL